MTRTTRASLTIKIAVGVACLACAYLIPGAGAASAAKSSTAHFTQESIQAYEQQLARGQIKLATFSVPKHTMRLTLTDGRHVHVIYAHGEEQKLHAALAAKGVSLPAVPKHHTVHKLRYIAVGVLVVVLILAGVAFMVIRRRRRAEEF
jgi:hypothetical protein